MPDDEEKLLESQIEAISCEMLLPQISEGFQKLLKITVIGF